MISILIPTFKNQELLITNLRNNLPYLKDCEIIIINDNPTDGIKKFVSLLNGRDKVIQNIVLIENKENLGFGESINQGAKIAKGRFLMLLNSDVRLINNNFQFSILNFQNNPNLFAVSFAQKEKDGTIVGKNKIFWKDGFYQHKKITDNKPGENGWAEGGSSLIDKEKFQQLGGFDKIYSPYYWEDIDLSQRAKKMGWLVIFDPKIEVIHHHESTIGKYYNRNEIDTIAFRNQLIFTWRNLTNFNQKIEHCYCLFLLVIINLVKGNLIYIKGLISALKAK